MQLHLQFPEATPLIQFWSQGGANYARFSKQLLKMEHFAPLRLGYCYDQIGSKRRSSFSWSPGAKYCGTISDGDCRYIVFNVCQHQDDENDCIAYAFPIVECADKPTVLQFSDSMQACRDIVIDRATFNNGNLYHE